MKKIILIIYLLVFVAQVYSHEMIYDVATNGHVGEMIKLLEQGANINIQNEEGTTLLMKAIVRNNLKMVKFLISKGANLVITDKFGHDALDWALISGNLEAAVYLVENNVDLNRKNKKGYTRLCASVLMGNTPSVYFLLNNGADVTKKSDNGLTPLRAAKQYNYMHIAKILNEKKSTADQAAII